MLQLLLDTELTAEQRDYVESGLEASKSLLFILNDLLDYSRIEVDSFELRPAGFRLRKSIQALLDYFPVQIREKNLKIHLEVEDDVPDVLFGDSYRLQQILIDCLCVAIKFSRPRSSITVAVYNDMLDDYEVVLRFVISGSEIRFPEEHNDDIFRSFSQGEPSTQRKYASTRLGLAVSSRLVSLMGGQAKMERQAEGKGAFHFTVPFELLEEDELSDDEGDEEERERKIGGERRKLRVLIVDDNEENQTFCATVLERNGHEVAVANNGKEAVDLSAQQNFDVVLMDIQMPEMDGDEAVRQIRKREQDLGKHLPIIAMTGYTLPEDRDSCLEAGMDDFLEKPISIDELEDKLRKLKISGK